VTLTLHARLAEASPAAEGYQQVGTVDGVRFWLDTHHAHSIGLRTTGRLGGICNQATSSPTIPFEACDGLVTGVGSVFAYVTADSVRGVVQGDDDGEQLTASGRIELGPQLPHAELVVIIVPGRVVYPASAPRFY
jgi:hypothetical protein